MGYAGVHESGKEHKDKGTLAPALQVQALPKVDARNCAGLVVELVETLVEAAWRAVRMSPLWKARFEELKKRKGSC